MSTHTIERIIRKLVATPEIIVTTLKGTLRESSLNKVMKTDEYREFLMQKNIIQERRKKLNEMISQLTTSQLKLLSKEKIDETPLTYVEHLNKGQLQIAPASARLLSGYFKALDKLEVLWKKRKDSEAFLHSAIVLSESLLDVFPIAKEYMLLDEAESSLNAASRSLDNLDIAFSSRNAVSLKFFLSRFPKEVEFTRKSLNGETNLQYLRCPAYDRLISLYVLIGEIDKAIQVCELGISRSDRTDFVGGFEQKIKSLQKKMEKAKSQNPSHTECSPV